MVDFRTPVEIDGVLVRPDDVIFGDIDGVVVVPAEAVEAVFQAALEKVRGEHLVREAIENGMSASDAFASFGIL